MPGRPAPYTAAVVSHRIPVEYATERKIRTRNKLYYRFNHWPIWIFVFFIAPGPLTFDLFERGFDLGWLCGWRRAGRHRHRRSARQLPGCEPAPYIIRFTEDRPNPLYRRICYTFAWGEAITFAVLNIVGLVVAIVHRDVDAQADLQLRLFPDGRANLVIGLSDNMPRVKPRRQARATNAATSTAPCGRWPSRSRSSGSST